MKMSLSKNKGCTETKLVLSCDVCETLLSDKSQSLVVKFDISILKIGIFNPLPKITLLEPSKDYV